MPEEWCSLDELCDCRECRIKDGVVVRCLVTIALCGKDERTNDEPLKVGMFREGERKFNISLHYFKDVEIGCSDRILTTHLFHQNQGCIDFDLYDSIQYAKDLEQAERSSGKTVKLRIRRNTKDVRLATRCLA